MISHWLAERAGKKFQTRQLNRARRTARMGRWKPAANAQSKQRSKREGASKRLRRRAGEDVQLMIWKTRIRNLRAMCVTAHTKQSDPRGMGHRERAGPGEREAGARDNRQAARCAPKRAAGMAQSKGNQKQRWMPGSQSAEVERDSVGGTKVVEPAGTSQSFSPSTFISNTLQTASDRSDRGEFSDRGFIGERTGFERPRDETSRGQPQQASNGRHGCSNTETAGRQTDTRQNVGSPAPNSCKQSTMHWGKFAPYEKA